MKLKELFPNLDIKGIKTNSKEVSEGDLFVCIKGANVDRHDYIDQAIDKGAIALITAKDVDVIVPYVKVDDPNEIIEDLYRDFYDNPQDKLKIIGVTGTDGKTTTTTLIQSLIGDDRCGYIGTNGYSCKGISGDTDNTTPGVEKLYEIFSDFVAAGCEYVAMEASSEGFYHGRLKNIEFEIGAYTNVDSEHLNTHKTLQNYIDCKKQLFKQCKTYSILNSNDIHFDEFLKVSDRPLTYGYLASDDLYIKEYTILPNKTDITFVYKDNEYQLVSPLLGKFNIENLAAAILVVLGLGFTFEDILPRIANLNVDGRMQAINLGQNYYCIVDYAHTTNGLRRLFEFIKSLDINRVITVMGQAGERDSSKRKTVGELLLKNSDYAILTTEDPRFEDVDSIIDMMLENVKDYDNYERIIDRHLAIAKAVELANENDMILILGKGNETYQKIKGEKIAFNDVEEAIKAIENREIK